MNFVQQVQEQIKSSQYINYKQSKTYIMGPILNVSMKREYETTLELAFEVVYGNFISEELVYEQIDRFQAKDKYISVSPYFMAQPNIKNILHLYDELYMNQSSRIQEKIAQMVQQNYVIDLKKINYNELLQDYYPIYEQKILDSKIAFNEKNNNKLKI